MLKGHESTEIAQFKAERTFTFLEYQDEDARSFRTSIELTDLYVRLVLDESEYDFTAQQCAELGDSLSSLLQTLIRRKDSDTGHVRPLGLDFCKLFHQMILSRTESTHRDYLDDHGYDLEGTQCGAIGSFRYPESLDYYQLFLGVNDDLLLPMLGIEDRTFTFSTGEASWLAEQLCVGGYLLAQFEQPTEDKPACL